jgi:2,3-bisphosphoglycerate-dependent phosphoglycerate mutase
VLVLARHGESAWNAADRFAGWIDVALTEAGRTEARNAGRWLREQRIVPTVAHTSLLRRARSTADLMLDESGASTVPVVRTDRLNERHYGALQGQRRTEAAARYGTEQLARWRRGVDDRPPADAEGRAESLADVRVRLRPYVDEQLLPALDAGHTVLVVSHGNALRMLVQLLEGLSDEAASALELPTGSARTLRSVDGLLRDG